MSREGKGGQEAAGLTENNMFFLSWLTARGSGTASVCLITLTDSPADIEIWWIGQGRIQDSRNSKYFISCLCWKQTCQDGLVHTQSGGLDGDDPDVSRHFVTNYCSHSSAQIKAQNQSLYSLKPHGLVSIWSIYFAALQFITMWQQLYSWTEDGGVQGWLTVLITLDGWCCCWKLTPQWELEGKGDLGEIMKWKEQVGQERQRTEST